MELDRDEGKAPTADENRVKRAAPGSGVLSLGGAMSPDKMLALQAMIGNRAVVDLVQPARARATGDSALPLPVRRTAVGSGAPTRAGPAAVVGPLVIAQRAGSTNPQVQRKIGGGGDTLKGRRVRKAGSPVTYTIRAVTQGLGGLIYHLMPEGGSRTIDVPEDDDDYQLLVDQKQAPVGAMPGPTAPLLTAPSSTLPTPAHPWGAPVKPSNPSRSLPNASSAPPTPNGPASNQGMILPVVPTVVPTRLDSGPLVGSATPAASNPAWPGAAHEPVDPGAESRSRAGRGGPPPLILTPATPKTSPPASGLLAPGRPVGVHPAGGAGVILTPATPKTPPPASGLLAPGRPVGVLPTGGTNVPIVPTAKSPSPTPGPVTPVTSVAGPPPGGTRVQELQAVDASLRDARLITTQDLIKVCGAASSPLSQGLVTALGRYQGYLNILFDLDPAADDLSKGLKGVLAAWTDLLTENTVQAQNMCRFLRRPILDEQATLDDIRDVVGVSKSSPGKQQMAAVARLNRLKGQTWSQALSTDKQWKEAIDAGYTEDRKFADAVGFHRIPYQGWKLHVTADARSLLALKQVLLPVLFARRINHKVVATVEGYIGMTKDPTQGGKYITIYPCDLADAKSIVTLIDNTVDGHRFTGPIPHGERPVGQSGLVSTRWGAFTGPTVRRPFGCPLPTKGSTSWYQGDIESCHGGMIDFRGKDCVVRLPSRKVVPIVFDDDGIACVEESDTRGGAYCPAWIKDPW